jgi:N6-L-threonylcarbamoyladenine synthase
LTPRLTGNVAFPYLALLVSGGHCQLVAVAGADDFEIYGTTADDAIGEAFDKTASLLGLSYPGGPAIEEAAMAGNPCAYLLPRPMLGRPNCDFSFSGLKTAMRKVVETMPSISGSKSVQADLAASFQAAVADVVADRTRNAVRRFRAERPDGRALVAAGGVASNRTVRAALQAVANEAGLDFVAPPPNLCTDNGAMVAWAGIEMMKTGRRSPLDLAPRPRWSLDESRLARQG